MRNELQQRDLAIAEVRGQLQGRADRERGPSGEMMDPKIRRAVKPFDGQSASWKTFSFQFKASFIAPDRRYRPLLEKCEGGSQEVDD
eukprot:484565-Pyramimonas_sp.AAC.1